MNMKRFLKKNTFYDFFEWTQRGKFCFSSNSDNNNKLSQIVNDLTSNKSFILNYVFLTLKLLTFRFFHCYWKSHFIYHFFFFYFRKCIETFFVISTIHSIYYHLCANLQISMKRRKYRMCHSDIMDYRLSNLIMCYSLVNLMIRNYKLTNNKRK